VKSNQGIPRSYVLSPWFRLGEKKQTGEERAQMGKEKGERGALITCSCRPLSQQGLCESARTRGSWSYVHVCRHLSLHVEWQHVYLVRQYSEKFGSLDD
jgi:hypothetical protein